MKFDVVLMNPPYQIVNSDGGKNSVFYKRFINRYEQFTSIMAFVCPWRYATGWMKPGTIIANETLAFTNQVSIRIGWFLWKAGCSDSVVIKDSIHPMAKQIADKTKHLEGYKADTGKLLWNTRVEAKRLHQAKPGEPSFKCHAGYYTYYDPNKIWDVPMYQLSQCYGYGYHKAVVSLVTGQGFKLIRYEEPNIAVSGHTMTVLFDTELEAHNFCKYVNTKVIKTIANAYRAGQSNKNCRRVFKAIPKLDMTRTWTDEDLYVEFGLTQEEIDYLESL